MKAELRAKIKESNRMHRELLEKGLSVFHTMTSKEVYVVETSKIALELATRYPDLETAHKALS